jgi:hypothetical protein
MGGVVIKNNEKGVIEKLRNQLEFYLGDSNLAKDRFLQKKLESTSQLELSLFLDFNRVKGIFGGCYIADRVEQLRLIQLAVKQSKMLKISKDKIKLKRRVPFRLDALDQKELDLKMVYVENFPDYINHDQLASIFRKTGNIKHVSIPKYKASKAGKGFAFIEYSS